MAMTPTERAALIADIAEASRAKIFEQRMTGPEIDPARKPTLHDYLVQTLPARTAAAIHGQWLGSSGPTIGIAIQTTYNTVAVLNGQLEALKAALNSITGGGLDLAAVEAAAKRGVEAGLAGAQVVIDFEGGAA